MELETDRHFDRKPRMEELKYAFVQRSSTVTCWAGACATVRLGRTVLLQTTSCFRDRARCLVATVLRQQAAEGTSRWQGLPAPSQSCGWPTCPIIGRAFLAIWP